MEERKFDPYQFIGFVLIALILTWMLYRNGPQDETSSNKEVETETSSTVKRNSEAQDSIRIQQKVTAYGDLGNLFVPNNYPNIEFSTEQMILEIQPRGGAISKLVLKEFENFNDQYVPMILDGNTEFNIELNTKDGRTLNTRDFYFNHEIFAYVFLGLIGVSNGLANILGSSTWAEIYGVKYIGSIKALTTALMVFSTAFGTAVFGVLIDQGFTIENIAFLGAVYVVISLALLILIRKTIEPVRLSN